MIESIFVVYRQMSELGILLNDEGLELPEYSTAESYVSLSQSSSEAVSPRFAASSSDLTLKLYCLFKLSMD